MTAQTKFLSVKTIVQLVVVLVLMPLLPMIISGVWDWWEAWAYVIVTIVGFVVSRVLAVQRHPDILNERSRSMELEDAKSWDKALAPAMALGSVVILIVAGVERLHGSMVTFPLAAKIASLIVIVLGYALGTWAMLANKFFSGIVRIQKGRGHRVVDTGPYRYVRHPGYAGTLFVYLVLPILFDSLWAFIPAVLMLVVAVARTYLEDKTLQNELPGYKEFTKKTKYRLLPWIW